MKTAEFKGMTFDYEEEHLDIHELPEITHDEAKALLFKFKTLSDELGIEFYLSFGTLLGAVRDKDFIKGDLDIDIYSKQEEKIFMSLPYLREKGIILIRYWENHLFSFRYDAVPGAYMDLYVWRTSCSLWGMYCYVINGNYVPKRLLNKTTKIDFLGEKFNCADNPVALLRFWYGDTWNIPIGKFEKRYKYDVASHYYFNMIKGKIIRAPKKVISIISSLWK